MTHRYAGWLLVLVAPWGVASADQVFGNGFEESCLVDRDQDRLVDCQEASRGLDADDPDTDDDGIGDGDEVLGTADGLDLPAFGTDPRRKDMLVEHDWQDDSVGCLLHSHKPSAGALDELRFAFAAMPVPNPDGTTGINLIQDIGQGGIFNGGNFVDVANALIVGKLDADFQAYKTQNFAANRLGYFHYVIHTHAFSTNPTSSGVAEIVGDDLLVTLRCNPSQPRIRNTLMHELGHNLGLRHGGDVNCNNKPNYNSVMNYLYQMPGIDTDCKLGGDGMMNYSIGARAPLDENHLDETVGMCGGIAIDWNPQDGGLLTDTSKDLTPYYGATAVFDQTEACGGILTTLTDHDDFAALNLAGLPGAPDGGVQDPPEQAVCLPVDSE
jgi:hypothetical protein